MKSMTGYGKGVFSQDGLNMTVEIRTVNNRFLDLSLKYPKGFLCFEDIMRKTISENIVRGKTDVFISFSDLRPKAKKVDLDMGLASSYVEAAKVLEQTFAELRNDVSINTLMKNPDILLVSNEFDDPDEIAKILRDTIIEACNNLNKMRQFEGEKLKKDFLQRMQNILFFVDEIAIEAPNVAISYKEKIETRMKELLEGKEYDEGRLLQEVSLYADKTNIDEEITRLRSHVSHFISICESSGDVGKKLDFLLQEFNRESNTICSKANDIKITDNALKLKCEIEKVREQVQNIE